jgi:methionyl-tRNA formyltransferase
VYNLDQMTERLVFMGTPDFAVPTLEALLTSACSIVAVYTRPDRPAGRGQKLMESPVKKLASSHGVPVIQPESLKPPGDQERLRALKPDAIVVAAYGMILPKWVLTLPEFGCLNVHPSLLPRHRGPSPVATAILEGDEVTGVTIMLVSERVDSGPVLSQQAVKIEPGDETGILTQRLARLGGGLLVETLPKWFTGKIKAQPQDESLATYSRKMTAEDGLIDWTRHAVEIWRLVRALQPSPGTYTTWSGKRLKVNRVMPVKAQVNGRPGEVVSAGPESTIPVGVVTGDGILGLCELQREGKRPVIADEFIRGHRDFIGSVLQ